MFVCACGIGERIFIYFFSKQACVFLIASFVRNMVCFKLRLTFQMTVFGVRFAGIYLKEEPGLARLRETVNFCRAHRHTLHTGPQNDIR